MMEKVLTLEPSNKSYELMGDIFSTEKEKKKRLDMTPQKKITRSWDQ